MKCQVDAIQWGGGGSSRIFSWSQRPDAIQWGGGVVAELFRGHDSVGAGSNMGFPFMGPFYIFGIFQRGGPGPQGPPLNRPLVKDSNY